MKRRNFLLDLLYSFLAILFFPRLIQDRREKFPEEAPLLLDDFEDGEPNGNGDILPYRLKWRGFDEYRQPCTEWMESTQIIPVSCRYVQWQIRHGRSTGLWPFPSKEWKQGFRG